MSLPTGGARSSGNAPAPQQARSLATLQRILEAARDLLEHEGWDGFTTEAIAQRADVSVGSIYRRFGDKDGVFIAVHEAHVAELAAHAKALFPLPDDPPEPDASTPADGSDNDQDAGVVEPPSDPRAAVRQAVTDLGRLFAARGALNGAMILNSSKIKGLGEHGALVMADVRRRFIQTIAAHAPAGNDRDVALAVCYRLAFSTFMDFATFNRFPVQAHEMSWSTLINEVAHACTSYLFDPSAHAPD